MEYKKDISFKNDNLYDNIKTTLSRAREKVSKAVNFAIVDAYWNIGRMIVEEEQNGEQRAGYGEHIIKYLSKKLTEDFGKGFSTTNLKYMRKFYKSFPISQTLSDQLSWSHYLLLSKIDEVEKRKFYFEE
ncbi:MAG: DUF1016 N-terminal domain-containing protein, partial [Marinisporobacter sp.]|nr:DUF1016 N-terminal domain-containing protein [Marinisporobacter sp.]